ncbi:hypothetical protein HanHA300_Chr13g0488011 [Helianthus annuus]|nr:hypothetical protein HanHA300_Chr13g0488011 [Helianthus annuus]KAJ0498229.1 hypothetical protein HanHA89_Chr13g0520201 [Helianthus annuus]KAJ0664232.1 hypothetical protein HanLR1_Chr13g0490061 [Helianthus annuus]KAJ0671704.1 hypothetical protein HanOQP8_Chr13g0488651 [Helianthus annuus]
MWANGVDAPINSLIRLFVVELFYSCNHIAPIENLVPDNPRDCVQGSRRSYQTVLETVCDLSSGTEFLNKIFLFVLVGLILHSAFD